MKVLLSFFCFVGFISFIFGLSEWGDAYHTITKYQQTSNVVKLESMSLMPCSLIYKCQPYNSEFFTCGDKTLHIKPEDYLYFGYFRENRTNCWFHFRDAKLYENENPLYICDPGSDDYNNLDKTNFIHNDQVCSIVHTNKDYDCAYYDLTFSYLNNNNILYRTGRKINYCCGMADPNCTNEYFNIAKPNFMKNVNSIYYNSHRPYEYQFRINDSFAVASIFIFLGLIAMSPIMFIICTYGCRRLYIGRQNNLSVGYNENLFDEGL